MCKRRLTMALLVVSVCLSFGATGARATEEKMLEEVTPQEVMGGMSNKLVRGLTNITTGWLEIPKQICLTTKEEGLAKGLSVGFVKGIGMTVVRTVSGAGETVTFPVAYPGFYDPFFEPGYVWERE